MEKYYLMGLVASALMVLSFCLMNKLNGDHENIFEVSTITFVVVCIFASWVGVVVILFRNINLIVDNKSYNKIMDEITL